MVTYPDPLPFKLRALRAVTATLKDITPDNGYYTNLADFDPGDGVTTSRVYRGRAWFGESDPIPMVSILEGVSPADEVAEAPRGALGSAYSWHLIIQGFVDDDPTNPTDPAYLLLADIRKRLGIEAGRKLPNSGGTLDPFGLGRGKNKITAMVVGPGVVRPADDVSSKAYCWLTVTLTIVDNLTDSTG